MGVCFQSIHFFAFQEFYNAKCSTTPIRREDRPRMGVVLFQFGFKCAPVQHR